MADLMLRVMINPSDDVRTGLEQANRWKPGDIVNVHRAQDHADIDGGGDYHVRGGINPNIRAGFIFVRNVPNSLALKAKEILELAHYDELLLLGPGKVMVRKRKWHVPPSIIPTAARNELLNNREITFTWNQVKPYVRRKSFSSLTDDSGDNIDIQLADNDLS